MDPFQSAALAAEIRTVADSVARAWPGLTTSDEVEDALWAPLTEEGVSTLMSAEPDLRSAALYRAAHQYAHHETLSAQYHAGRVHYSTSEVRRLLDAGVLSASRSGLDPNRDSLASFMDVHGAVVQIAWPHRWLLGRTFLLGEEITNRGAVNRAVQALTGAMNKER